MFSLYFEFILCFARDSQLINLFVSGSNGHSSGGSLCWITETSELDPEPSSSGTCSALSAGTCSEKPTSFSDPGDKLNLTCSPSPRECLESEPCKEDRPPSINSHPGDGTDLVHRRLKVRDQHNQQEAAGASGGAGHGSEAGVGEKEEEKFEFRNKSEENLVSIHRNGKTQRYNWIIAILTTFISLMRIKRFYP